MMGFYLDININLTLLIRITGFLNFIFLFTFFFASGFVSADEINLKDAIRILKQRSYDAQISMLEIKKGEGIYIQSGLFQNPIFSANYTGLLFGKRFIYDSDNTLLSLRLEQPIELGGKRTFRRLSALYQLESIKYQVLDNIRSLILNFIDIYFQTLSDKAYIDYLQQSLNDFEEILTVQSRKYQLGFLSYSEIIKLELYKMELENSLIQSEADYQKDLKDFNFYLGGNYSPAPVPINEPYEPDVQLDSIIKTALEKREIIKALQAGAKSVDYQVKLLKAYSIPDISLGVEYDSFGTDYKPGIGFGFSLNLPIFDRRQGDLLVALTTREQISLEMERIIALIKSQIEKAFYDYQMSRKIYLSFVEKKKIMDELLERTKKAYLLGGISLLDFLDTQRTYRNFMNGFIQAKYNFLKNFYKLKILIGETEDEI